MLKWQNQLNIRRNKENFKFLFFKYKKASVEISADAFLLGDLCIIQLKPILNQKLNLCPPMDD